jgi:hypothetical protein
MVTDPCHDIIFEANFTFLKPLRDGSARAKFLFSTSTAPDMAFEAATDISATCRTF